MLLDVFLSPGHSAGDGPICNHSGPTHVHSSTGKRLFHSRHIECFKPYDPGKLPFIRRKTGPSVSHSGRASAFSSSPSRRIYFDLTGPVIMDPRRAGRTSGTSSGTGNAQWKLGKVTTEVSPADLKVISKDIPSKTWKAVRFSSTFSRGSNTPTSITVSKAVQTASTAYSLRLKRWPVWTATESWGNNPSINQGFYLGHSGSNRLDQFYHPLWIRRILSFVFSQFGIVLFLATWISGNAALFQLLEQAPDLKLVNEVTSSRNELVVTLATELRQVFPYEMAWRRKIDDYFIKFENSLNNATLRGYSTSKRAFYKWDYLDFFLFSLQLVTGQGFGADVPKTEWSHILSVPCVMIGLPFMWLFLLDLGAKWADNLSGIIQQFRWQLARHYPDVVALQTDGIAGPPSASHVPLAPKVYQNGGSPIVTQNGNGSVRAVMANGGDIPYTYPALLEEEDEATSPVPRAVWTVEPPRTPPPPPSLAIPVVKVVKKKNQLTGGSDHHHAAPWVSTVFTVLYPLLGSVVFGLWADLSVASSFVLPLTSLLLINPPPPLVSYWWRSLFHMYLLVGWVLGIASCLLWLHTWRNIFKQWAHDLSIKKANRTFPLQVR